MEQSSLLDHHEIGERITIRILSELLHDEVSRHALEVDDVLNGRLERLHRGVQAIHEALEVGLMLCSKLLPCGVGTLKDVLVRLLMTCSLPAFGQSTASKYPDFAGCVFRAFGTCNRDLLRWIFSPM